MNNLDNKCIKLKKKINKKNLLISKYYFKL